MPQTLDDLEDFAERGRRAQEVIDSLDAQVTTVRRVLSEITYQDMPRALRFECGRSPGGVWLEVVCFRRDARTREPGVGRGGKRYLGTSFTVSDVVRLVFGAIAAYEEHELRESFLFRGVPVHSPHLDLERLAEQLTTHTQED